MSAPFALKLAWRESRHSWRRLGIYMSAITLGVGALVAINSFRANVLDSIRGEARTLLGGDLRLESPAAFPPSVQSLLDSIAATGAPISYVTSTASMALANRSGRTRLFQLRAITGEYPHYGQPVTEPPGRWRAWDGQRLALVDPALLVQLDASVGDTLQVGAARFTIAGTVSGLPSEIGFQTAIGPRIFIPGEFLDETDLIRFGSLVQYQALLQLPEPEVRRFVADFQPMLREQRIRVQTAEGEARSLIRAYGSLGNFLGLVGLMALLLGGIGVGSAVHVFVKEKLTTVAVLRCLGATQRSVFSAYLLQAGLLGLAGSTAGVLLGVALQGLLPWLLRDYLPVTVEFALDMRAILAGLGIGVWVAALFSILPMLTLRDVAPLQALRRDLEPGAGGGRALRALVLGALVVSVIGLSLWQAPTRNVGFAFAGGLAATTALLWATALLLVWATRRFFPRGAPYVLRQGIANLFRPRNQTVVITLSIGFGVFLLATLYLVQRNLLDRLDLGGGDRPSLLLFDIQPDQWPGIQELVAARGLPALEVTPIVPSRLAQVNGRSVEEILRGGDNPARWALRREYRHTYRADLAPTEQLAAGEWWTPESTGTGASVRSPYDPVRISMDEGLAASLGVGIGDHITWDFYGVAIESRITSLRTVDWTNFAPNFYVVFEPGGIERAPHSLVALGRIEDAESRAALQRDLVLRYPNVSALDLAVVQEAVDAIAGKVAIAIRGLAVFGIAGGVIVLVGALATSRYQRRRESALLKTLGASKRQVASVLLTEYLALGSLAALTGVLLAVAAAWLLMEHLFQLPFGLPVAALAGVWLAVVALTLAVGFLNSRDVLRRSPLAVLQDAYE
jgi:putative ABC transport system permease protein